MQQATCSEDGCENTLRPRVGARGLCGTCYSRWHRSTHGRKRKRFDLTCVVCAEDFQATSPDAKYCSTGAGSCETRAKTGMDCRTGFATSAGYVEEVLARIGREPTSHDIGDYKHALLSDPCAYCGAPSEHRDHIVPRSHGGANDWTNRTGACSLCNNSKQSTPLLVFLAWKATRDEFEPWREIVATLHTRTGA